MDTYDLIIIGTGAGGGTLLHKLKDTGKRILVLERGGFLPREKANWDSKAVFQDERYHTKEVWKTKEGKELNPGTGTELAAILRFMARRSLVSWNVI